MVPMVSYSHSIAEDMVACSICNVERCLETFLVAIANGVDERRSSTFTSKYIRTVKTPLSTLRSNSGGVHIPKVPIGDCEPSNATEMLVFIPCVVCKRQRPSERCLKILGALCHDYRSVSSADHGILKQDAQASAKLDLLCLFLLQLPLLLYLERPPWQALKGTISLLKFFV